MRKKRGRNRKVPDQKGSIFDRIRLRPGQIRTVADRRYNDAESLRKTRENARANGAMYLGGYTIECLLKAKLMEKHKWLQTTYSPEKLPKKERKIWELCFRKHDLDELLAALPEVENRLAALGQQGNPRMLSH